MQDESIKFSVIVPIYNVEKYLTRCINSIINQTYKNLEIVLVDDESPDNCPAMCDEYAKNDTRIKVIHKKNGGLSDARNAGMNIATSDYVIFVDSDDYIELDSCEKFYEYAKHGYDIIIGDAIVEGITRGELSHISENAVLCGDVYYKKALSQRKAPNASWLNAYRIDFLKKNNLQFKTGILHEDFEFTPRAIIIAKTVICTHAAFYHYVVRENSITTHKDKRKNVSDLYTTCCEHEKRFNNLSDSELRRLLLDSLVKSYLSMFQDAKAFCYGSEYIHKDFCVRNSFEFATKIKSILFYISPKLYWHINAITKKCSGRS